VRIDQPDEDGGWADDADTPDAPYAEGAAGSRLGDRERAVPAASADSADSAASGGEHEAYRARVDAVFRAHAIDQDNQADIGQAHLQRSATPGPVRSGLDGQRDGGRRP
jgi:hypothetical protein